MIKPKRKERNSSFNARLFLQFKMLVKSINSEIRIGTDITGLTRIELEKAEMLLNEKEKRNEQKRNKASNNESS